jgi:hypothetical protein
MRAASFDPVLMHGHVSSPAFAWLGSISPGDYNVEDELAVARLEQAGSM